MKIVGITGGIGVGKSTVSKIFKILGIPVYDADSRAKRLMNEDPEIRATVIEFFGEESYRNGELDRTHVGKIAFHKKELLNHLNTVVHPAVARDFRQWSSEQDAPYVMKEAALLVENGSSKDLDYLIVVSAPEKIRIDRVLERDPHRNLDDVKAIIAKQFPEARKLELADHIIVNDGSQLVIPQVLSVHHAIL